MTTEEMFVDCALKYIGCHYIWEGKGQKIWTMKQGLITHKFTELNDNTQLLNVFDCSGLVTHCLWMVTHGLLDLRGTHSAHTIFMTFPLAGDGEEDGTVRCYSGHVAISLGRNRVVEAAGGDEMTTSVQAAMSRNAQVRAGVDLRQPYQILGLRRIPLDKSQLRTV